MSHLQKTIRLTRYPMLGLLLSLSCWAGAQPSMQPASSIEQLPELGVVAPQPGSTAPLAEDMQPRKKLVIKPRMKSDELKPALRPGFSPEMSPGLQPNSQKPLHTDAPVRRGGGPAN